jgi:hypothetical protein
MNSPLIVTTGFWDRQPRRTQGRFRRMLMGVFCKIKTDQ